jgi:competence protein ComEC
MTYFTSSYTFRLTVPLALGILLADLCAPRLPLAPLLGGFAAASALLFLLLLFFLWRDRSFFKRKYGITLGLLTLALGGTLCLLQHRATRVDWPQGDAAYRAWVYDRPVRKKRHLRCPVQVDGYRVWAYLPDDSAALALQRGQEILLYGTVHCADTSHFDRMLFHQGVAGNVFVRPGRWQSTGRTRPLSLRQQALTCRDAVVSLYRSWGIRGDELAVLSALTVGQTDELGTDLRGQFSAAGISHVLALSGLHVGLVWAVLNLLLPAYIASAGWRWARWAGVTAALAAYVWLAGLPPSAVRAALMCVLWEANRCVGHEYTPRLHSLFGVGFVLLLVNPFYLFQLSFQLSMVAVGTILMFFEPTLELAHRFLGRNASRSTWLVIPLVAQMGVAPLSLYYFHTFPVYFLLASLAAVWLAQAIVYTALVTALAWIVGLVVPFGWITALGAKAVHALLWALVMLARGVSGLPHALCRVEGFGAFEVVMMYLYIIMCYRWVVQPTRRRALQAFVALDFELFLWIFR